MGNRLTYTTVAQGEVVLSKRQGFTSPNRSRM